MAAAFEGLPEELMTLILSKLPVKSLLRFKCVQKSWYFLIKSPQFVHLHRSSSSSSSSSSSTSSINDDCFIVARSIPLERHFLSFYSYETLAVLGNEINIPIPSHTVAWLCGSCDGLVCIADNKNQIVICNPTIRELRSLSFPPAIQRSGFNIDSVAFGSDPNTGQFTLVMIGVPNDSPHYHQVGDHKAFVYNFTTDSWIKTAAVIRGLFFYYRRAISFNGAFHWCPSGDSNILTFHISSNEATEFDFIPLPDFVGIYGHKEVSVSSNKSHLSLILYGHGGWIEVCVMTEYGVKESWTRLFNIETHLLGNFEPISFWDEHHVLIRTSQGQLVSCNLRNQNLRHFPIVGDFDLCPYSQSLVSVNGIGHPVI